jgi:hypothetical protein
MTNPPLRLPRTLVYTTIRCTLAGALACSSQGETRPDASTDAYVAHDSPIACETGAVIFCGSSGPCDGPCPCPGVGAYYCSRLCPPGCDPFS